jgi:hypothetical protein
LRDDSAILTLASASATSALVVRTAKWNLSTSVSATYSLLRWPSFRGSIQIALGVLEQGGGPPQFGLPRFERGLIAVQIGAVDPGVDLAQNVSLRDLLVEIDERMRDVDRPGNERANGDRPHRLHLARRVDDRHDRPAGHLRQADPRLVPLFPPGGSGVPPPAARGCNDQQDRAQSEKTLHIGQVRKKGRRRPDFGAIDRNRAECRIRDGGRSSMLGVP